MITAVTANAFRHAQTLARSQNLMAAIQEGKIDAEFERLIADSVGLNQEAIERRMNSTPSSNSSQMVAGDASFAIQPIGPGKVKIREAPAVVSIAKDPFNGFSSEKKPEWLATWKNWASANRDTWRRTVTLPEGPVRISEKTAKELGMIRRGESIAAHFQAAVSLPELLENSKLAIVEAPLGKPEAQEIHKRYAWADFPDGKRPHVMMTVIRWKSDTNADSAYSLETIEVQEEAVDALAGVKPTASTARAASGDRDILPRFLSGIKVEHKEDATSATSPEGTVDISPSSGDPSFSLSAVPGGFQFASEDERRQVENAAFAAAKHSGVVNTDDVRPLIPGYADADPLTRDARFHDAASSITTRIIDRMLAEPSNTGRVLILAGGGGSGKSTIAGGFPDNVDITFDFTLSDPAFARELLQKIHSSGREANIGYVHRRFPASFENIVRRYLREKARTGMGRIVPLPVAVRAHVGAQETLFGLDGEVDISIIDNNGSLGEMHGITLETLAKDRYVQTNEGISSTLGLREQGQESPHGASAEGSSGIRTDHRRDQAEESLRKEGEGILRALRDAGDLTDAEFAAFLGRDDS
jgi:hypothetical protein